MLHEIIGGTASITKGSYLLERQTVFPDNFELTVVSGG